MLRRAVPVSAAVLDLAVHGDTVWVATRGGGLLGMSRDGTLRTRFDVGRGLPSAVVLQVEVLADGRLVAGTARGPVILDPSSGSAVLPLDRHLAGASADLVVASPADASAVVQITGGDAIVGERATSSLWRVDARGATPWGEFLGPDATVTAGAVDAAGRCRLLAGTRGHWPRAESWVTRECGGAPILRIVQVGLPSPVLAVAAVGVSRNGERTAAVLVTQSSLDPRTRRHHLVEIAGDGSLESLCPGEPDLGEATALVRRRALREAAAAHRDVRRPRAAPCGRAAAGHRARGGGRRDAVDRHLQRCSRAPGGGHGSAARARSRARRAVARRAAVGRARRRGSGGLRGPGNRCSPARGPGLGRAPALAAGPGPSGHRWSSGKARICSSR